MKFIYKLNFILKSKFHFSHEIYFVYLSDTYMHNMFRNVLSSFEIVFETLCVYPFSGARIQLLTMNTNLGCKSISVIQNQYRLFFRSGPVILRMRIQRYLIY